MATVITTQPTITSIIDPEIITQTSTFNSINVGDELIKTNGDIKGDTRLLTDGVISEDMVYLNSVEGDQEKRRLKEDEERRSQEQARNDEEIQDCCCVSDDYDNCCLLDCIVSCFRTIAIGTDNCFSDCGNCISSCCEDGDAVVDSEDVPSCFDCGGCDCSGCDCSGCDCSGCDCGDCNCEDCATCCLCFCGILECCKD